ncbi:MAG: hypothetical protein ACRYFS_04360 [Janthinobacterium lividum]
MSSPNDPFQPSCEIAALELQKAQIEDYLDYLCSPLLGIVPYAQRRRLRLETEDHLLALTEDFQAEGFLPEEAVSVALREYGEPWQIGQSFADAWLTGKLPSRLTRFTDAATLQAFGWFGVFSVLNLLLTEQYVLGPSQPSSLPLLACLVVLSPIFAGIMTGLTLNPAAGRGVCRAMLTLSLASAVIGGLILPHTEVLELAGFQLLFWVPIGCLSATVTASLSRQLRIQTFHRTTRRSEGGLR